MERKKEKKTKKETSTKKEKKTKKVKVDKNLVLFRKEGGGSLRIKGKIIKPGQTIEIDPAEIPEVFRSTLMPVSKDARTLQVIARAESKGDVKEVKVQSKNIVQPVYKKVKNEELSTDEVELFDIVDAEGKLISEEGQPLTEKVAMETLKALS